VCGKAKRNPLGACFAVDFAAQVGHLLSDAFHGGVILSRCLNGDTPPVLDGMRLFATSGSG